MLHCQERVVNLLAPAREAARLLNVAWCEIACLDRDLKEIEEGTRIHPTCRANPETLELLKAHCHELRAAIAAEEKESSE